LRKSGAKAPLFFFARCLRNDFVSMFLYSNFSNKSATSFRQSGNNCRPCPARISSLRQNLPGTNDLGKSAPERIFRVRAKSMFKQI
jgi:hypothetical protein